MPETVINAPKGFEIQSEGSGDLKITYKSSGMGCFLGFLSLLLVLLFGAVVFLTLQDAEGMRRVINGRGAWIGFGGGMIAVIYFASVIVFHVFGSTVFELNTRNLRIRKQLLGLHLDRSIDRAEIEYIEQVSDNNGDSFPSWGLNLVADRHFRLLVRQPIEKSDWLGQTLAEFYSVEFRRSSIQ